MTEAKELAALVSEEARYIREVLMVFNRAHAEVLEIYNEAIDKIKNLRR